MIFIEQGQMFLLQFNLMSFGVDNVPILSIQKVSLSVDEVCGCINEHLLEFITISFSSLPRGLDIPVRPTLLFWKFWLFIKNISRYSIMIGDNVLWIVDGLILEGDFLPNDWSALPNVKKNVLF